MRRLGVAILLVFTGPASAIHAGTAFEDPIYGFSTTSARSPLRGPGEYQSPWAGLALFSVFESMLAVARAATPWGIEARAVDVEVDVHNGLPGIQIVGLPDTAVRESRER